MSALTGSNNDVIAYTSIASTINSDTLLIRDK